MATAQSLCAGLARAGCRAGRRAALGLLLTLPGAATWCGTVQVAVAANFASPAKAIAAQFEKATGHVVALTSGATGRFYAQIKSGAPFEVFLSADDEAPARLDMDGDTVANTRFTYAVGRLALWSARAGYVDDRGAILKNGSFKHLALASPKLAPYGAAAVEVMAKLGLAKALEPRFVLGENLGQAYAFVDTGNAELGFVALSQVMDHGRLRKGSVWQVPLDLHTPLIQDAVLLKRGKDNPAARAFMQYLRSAPVQALVRTMGYEASP